MRVMLQAFFDETGGNEKDAVTAVAGFIYDEPGLKHFTEVWTPKVSGLSKPFHSTACNAGEEPFNPPDWPEWRRQSLLDELASLTAETALAGFVTAMQHTDFQEAKENRVRNLVDSPYTACVLDVLAMVAKWAEQTGRTEHISYWFESGGHHQKETQDFVRRIEQTPKARSQFHLDGYSWESKRSVPAFCSADLLAWEWQRNVLKTPDEWSPRMGIIAGDESMPLYPQHLTAAKITHWALFNLCHSLHQD